MGLIKASVNIKYSHILVIFSGIYIFKNMYTKKKRLGARYALAS